jgi:hypothetical protein
MTIVDRRYSVAEGTAVKAPCLVTTTANITLSGLQSIDGVTVAENDRVLVKSQTTGTENGIYSASSGNWSRTRDFDGAYDIVQGTRVFVTAGSTLAGNEYYVSTSGTITIDSTSITFTQMPASGIAASVAAAAASAATASSAASAASVSAAAAAVSAATFQFSTPVTGVDTTGVTDARAGIQSVIDAVSAAGGGYVHLGAGKTYRIVINTGVTGLGLIIKSGVTLFVNESTINLECTGDVYGIRFQDDAHILGPGAVAVTVSSGPGSQSIWHAPIALGAALGEVTSVGALGSYINATRWSVRKLSLTSVRADGYKIAGIGGMSHGVIEDIEFPSDSTSIGCLNFDWGTVGSIDSSDIPASRVLFNAGTAYTVHPNNIDIRRLKIGTMSHASSNPIRLSGVHDIRIDGFEIVSCKAYGIFHTAGDLGYEFADSDTKRRRHSGIVIKNGLIQFATTGQAVYCDAYADNVALAISGGYVQLLDAVNPIDIIFENIRSIGNIASNAGDGIQVRFMNGGTIRNCTMIGHQRGIFVDSGALNVHIEGGEINSSYQDGIYIGAGTVPEEITVDGVWCWSNGVGGVYAGITVFNGKFHKITRCRFGANSGGDSFQDIGLEIGSACSGVRVTLNHVLAASNVAYKIGAVGFYNAVVLFANNTVESAVVTPFGGVEIICVGQDYSLQGSRRKFLMTRSVAATTPSTGTWVIGDTIEFSDPVTTGYKGTVCTVSGTPGTWKNFGAIT